MFRNEVRARYPKSRWRVAVSLSERGRGRERGGDILTP